jgi:hypothetical protein
VGLVPDGTAAGYFCVKRLQPSRQPTMRRLRSAAAGQVIPRPPWFLPATSDKRPTTVTEFPAFDPAPPAPSA